MSQFSDLMNKPLNKEDQMWLIIFLMIPTIVFSMMAKELHEATGIMQTLVAGAGGMAGAIVGFALHSLVKDRNASVKALAAVALLVFILGVVFMLRPTPTPDAEIVNQEWPVDTLGLFEFQAPTPLKEQSIAIPDSLKSALSNIELRVDMQDSRFISYIHWSLLEDTVQIMNGYDRVLTSMLERLPYKYENLAILLEAEGEEFLETTISWTYNGDTLRGYGVMAKKDKNIDSMWLMPIEKSFSKEYIETFMWGIDPIF